MEAGRSQWVDAARGLGILLVVYAHVARGVVAAGMVDDDSGLKLIDSVIYTFHMPLFFFLSGLLFRDSLQRRGARAMALGKIDALLYPYVLWSLLQGGMEVAFSHFTNSAVSPGEVLNLLHPRAQFWFLWALLGVTLLAIPVYAGLRGRFAGLIALAALGLFLVRPALPELFSAYVAMWFVFFALGVWFSTMLRQVSSLERRLFPAFLLLFAASQWFYHGVLGKTYEESGAALLPLAAIGIATVVLLARRLKHWPWLAMLGRASLAIYLMHVLVGSGLRVMLKSVLHVVDPMVHIVIGTLAAVLGSWAMWALACRWRLGLLFEPPARLSLSRLVRKSRTAAEAA